MAKKTAAERCGFFLLPDDKERIEELFEDETGESCIDFAALGKVIYGVVLHMSSGYDRDKIKELFGGLSKVESITLRDWMKRHDEYKDHYVKRCAAMSRRRRYLLGMDDEEDEDDEE